MERHAAVELYSELKPTPFPFSTYNAKKRVSSIVEKLFFTDARIEIWPRNYFYYFKKLNVPLNVFGFKGPGRTKGNFITFILSYHIPEIGC